MFRGLKAWFSSLSSVRIFLRFNRLAAASPSRGEQGGRWRKSLEGCVPVRVNRLKEILRWDPTDERKRGKTRHFKNRARNSLIIKVVEQNMTFPVQLP